MRILFYKYEGTGNDFVMIDNRDDFFVPGREIVKRLCDRHFGIGADGMILLGADGNTSFSMRYFNADGNEGTMCGNGGRCTVLFAKQLGLITDEADFVAVDGLHYAKILDENNGVANVRLKMKDVENIIEKQGQWLIDTGSPHLVIPVGNPEEIDVRSDGRKIRYSALFADEGINVNFIKILDNRVIMRTYERGVEDETLSCGTGTVAAAVAAISSNHRIVSPVYVQTPGGNLKVFLTRESQKYSDIWLEGQARFVFKGEIKV